MTVRRCRSILPALLGLLRRGAVVQTRPHRNRTAITFYVCFTLPQRSIVALLRARQLTNNISPVLRQTLKTLLRLALAPRR